MRLYQLIILYLIAITLSGKAQTIPSKNITINDGLPSNETTAKLGLLVF